MTRSRLWKPTPAIKYNSCRNRCKRWWRTTNKLLPTSNLNLLLRKPWCRQISRSGWRRWRQCLRGSFTILKTLRNRRRLASDVILRRSLTNSKTCWRMKRRRWAKQARSARSNCSVRSINSRSNSMTRINTSRRSPRLLQTLRETSRTGTARLLA